MLTTTNTAAPASSPPPAGATPPSSTASGNSSKASAATIAPLAKASMTPVTRLGASQYEPSAPPTTSELVASTPNRTASHMARGQYLPEAALIRPGAAHSHSIVPGGLEVTS